MARAQGNPFVNMPDSALQLRLAEIERNILFLDGPATPRDNLEPERGWLSPWWWWRMHHWTIKELQRRDLSTASGVEIPSAPLLRPEFRGVFAGGRRLLIRISRQDRILETLKGRLRFAPARGYNDVKLGAARADEEMAKSYLRPGQNLIVTASDGRQLKPIGDVTFATRRAVEHEGGLVETPYWLCSFSSDLDTRLFTEFKNQDNLPDACLVIFDPDEFMRRAAPKIREMAPTAVQHLFPNVYFDPYNPPTEELSTVRHKHFSFALQREMRFLIDPNESPWSTCSASEAFFVDVGSLEDIAAAYEPIGTRLCGTGPDTFLA